MKSYKKIYNYYLDLMLKDKKVFWDYNGLDGGYLLSDSYIISIVPDMFFNKDNNEVRKTNLEHFIEDLILEDYVEPSTIRLYSDNVIGFIYTSDLEVDISEKYYKLYKGYTFKIKSELEPVLVYDNEKLVAFILPLKSY